MDGVHRAPPTLFLVSLRFSPRSLRLRVEIDCLFGSACFWATLWSGAVKEFRKRETRVLLPPFP